MDPQTAPSRLTLFSLLVAWTNLLHQLSHPSFIKALEPLGWLISIASLALAVKPSNFRLLVSLLVLRVAYTAHWIPMIRGHLFVEGLFTLGVLIGLGLGLWKLRKLGDFTRDEQETLFESFAPVLRVTTLAVYGAVTLSKLNYEFFDVEKSAAVQFLLWADRDYPMLPIPMTPAAFQFSIWGTLAFEAGIPVLLCFRRTRWYGILLGLIFHTLLGLHPLRIATFSMTMCLLLFSWLPPESPQLIYNRYLQLARRLRMTPTALSLCVSCLAWITGFVYAGRNGFNLDMHALDLGLGLWWWQTAILFAALWSLRSADYGRLWPLLIPRFPVLWLYAAFLMFNWLCPYIGLKTRTALTMHCNLHTEKGYWNHLFLPSKMKVFHFQEDLVEVIDSDLPDFAHLQATGMPLPYFEFRRWCRLADEDFYVEYRRRDGPILRFEKMHGTGSDPTLMASQPWLEWFLCFNPVGTKHDYIPSLVKRTGPARNIVPVIPVPETD